jgi:hypothetical protein
VSFNNNDSDENPFNFSIAGTLATAPEVAVSGNGQNIADGDGTPGTADGTDFGTSASPVDHTFTVTNTGTATLTLSGLTVPSGFGIVEGLSASLAPGASDTFTVRFLATGNASGQVSFNNNDSDENPFNFSIAGTLATAPEVAVSGNGQNIADGDSTPSTTDGTDFGTSASPVDHTFTVTNSGTATLTLSGLTVPSGFGIVEGLSASLAPGASDTFKVRFLATGNASGQVSFNNNDANENPFNFSIAGSVPTGGPPTAPANPQATPFSSTRVDLKWDDMSNNETGFRIEVATSPSGPWSTCMTLAANKELCAVKQLLDNTNYYFRVAAFNANGTSSYVTTTATKTLDNSSYATAENRAKPPVRPHAKDIVNFVGDSDTLDYFRFHMAYNGNFTATLDNLQAGEAVTLQLLRSNGSVIDTDSSSLANPTPTVNGSWLPAADYFVGVVRNAPGDNSNYRLMLLADYAGGDISRTNFIGNVGNAGSGGVKKGWIGDGDVSDWYKFRVTPATTNVSIVLSGLSDDLDVILRDSAGNEITRSELGGAADDIITRGLGVGTYYVEVLRQQPTVSSNYLLTVQPA